MASVQVGRANVVLRLIQLHADLEAKDLNGATALMLACKMKILREIRGSFVESVPLWIQTKKGKEKCPVESDDSTEKRKMLASLVKTITTLCEYGDVEAQDDRGWAAMHHAAYSASGEALKVLLDSGANPNSRAKDGTTPTMAAAAGARAQMMHPRARGLRRELTRLEILLNSEPRFVTRVQQVKIDEMKKDYSDVQGKIKAIDADVQKYSDVVSILYQGGANIHGHCHKNVTALMIAAEAGCKQLVPSLARLLAHTFSCPLFLY